MNQMTDYMKAIDLIQLIKFKPIYFNILASKKAQSKSGIWYVWLFMWCIKTR